MNIRKLNERLGKLLESNFVDHGYESITIPASLDETYSGKIELFYNGTFGYCETFLGSEEDGFKRAREAFNAACRNITEFREYDDEIKDNENYTPSLDFHVKDLGKMLKDFEYDCLIGE